MCLSTVYALRPEGKAQIAKNVASVKQQDGKLILTDIMGVPTVVNADIERIDLMDNFIWVRER